MESKIINADSIKDLPFDENGNLPVGTYSIPYTGGDLCDGEEDEQRPT